MARIAGVTIPDQKQVQISLTYIYGIGPVFARAILQTAKIDPTTRVKDLTEAEQTRLREVIDNNYTVEGDLQRQVSVQCQLVNCTFKRLLITLSSPLPTRRVMFWALQVPEPAAFVVAKKAPPTLHKLRVKKLPTLSKLLMA